MFKTEQKAFERFGADLARELQIEIGKLSDDGARTGLDQAGERLRDAIARLTEMATAMPDRRQGAKLLRVSLDLMFAAADTASRVDHKRVPRITETVMKARAGKASGLARATKAERQWKNKATSLARGIYKTQPGFSMSALARRVAEKWDGELPVSPRALTEFLRSVDIFKKVHV
jgi:hypothetical protein